VNQNSQFWFIKIQTTQVMTIQKIIGADGPRDQMLCRGGGCPAVILTEEGDLFVQGYTPSAAESDHLTGPAGEGFVRIPREVFEKIARQVLKA
jgi:hypothetical protein